MFYLVYTSFSIVGVLFCSLFLFIPDYVITGIFLLHGIYHFYRQKKTFKRRIHTLICNEWMSAIYYFGFRDFWLDNLCVQEKKAFHHEKMLKNQVMDSRKISSVFYLPLQRSRALCGNREEGNIICSRQFAHLIYTEFHMFSLTSSLVFRLVSRLPLWGEDFSFMYLQLKAVHPETLETSRFWYCFLGVRTKPSNIDSSA